jgi:hypothetical protein
MPRYRNDAPRENLQATELLYLVFADPRSGNILFPMVTSVAAIVAFLNYTLSSYSLASRFVLGQYMRIRLATILPLKEFLSSY